MDDLISRAAAIGYAISGRVRTLPTSEDGENWIRTEEVRQSLSTMPSADRPTGKWIEYDTENERYSDIRCSCCQRLFTVDSYHFTDIGFTKDDLNFCPNCGSYNGGVQSEID